MNRVKGIKKVKPREELYKEEYSGSLEERIIQWDEVKSVEHM